MGIHGIPTGMNILTASVVVFCLSSAVLSVQANNEFEDLHSEDPFVDVYSAPMSREVRSKFSRILRANKFARIVRDPNLLRIARAQEGRYSRIMRAPVPELKFTRILRSEPKFLRILRGCEDGEEYTEVL